jgi:DNA-binding NtrC family response regulator
MRSILVISSREVASKDVASGFRFGTRFDTASGRDAGLALLVKNRYDLVFVDLEILTEGVEGADAAAALHPFGALLPTIEIVVIAPQKGIRQAVKFVEAGASDYLSYPFERSELKLVAENIEKRIIRQSELDYLRNRFWQAETVVETRTGNLKMKDLFENIRSAEAAGISTRQLHKLMTEYALRKEDFKR